MSRIPLADPAAIRQWAEDRDTLNVVRLLANAPNIFDSWARMTGELFTSPTFTPRMREVIILRVAHLQDSPYERAQHTIFGRTAGLTDQQIDAITGRGDLDAAALTSDERAALDVVTELCTTRHLRDESFAAAQAVFGDEALTELLMIVSCYYGLALVLNAVDLEIDTPTFSSPEQGLAK